MVQSECYRLQRFFPFLGCQLTFPYRYAMPAHSGQFLLLLTITLFVPTNLRNPELMVRLRNLTAW